MNVYLYSDGSPSGSNPSYTGGSWAFRIVRHHLARRFVGITLYGPLDDEKDELLDAGSGVVLPSEQSRATVTNNQMELTALCRGILALEALRPAPGTVYLCPDSLFALRSVTLRRVPDVPATVATLLRQSWQFMSAYPALFVGDLISGHPEEGPVMDGLKEKSSGRYRVSRHNAECDAVCTALCKDLIPPPAEEINARAHGLFTVGEVAAIKTGKSRRMTG